MRQSDRTERFDSIHETLQRELLKATSTGKTSSKTIIFSSVQTSAENILQVVTLVDGIIPGIADFKSELSQNKWFRVSTNRSRSNSLVNEFWDENIFAESVHSVKSGLIPRHIVLMNNVIMPLHDHSKIVDLANYEVLKGIMNANGDTLSYNVQNRLVMEIYGNPAMINISATPTTSAEDRISVMGSFVPIEVCKTITTFQRCAAWHKNPCHSR